MATRRAKFLASGGTADRKRELGPPRARPIVSVEELYRDYAHDVRHALGGFGVPVADLDDALHEVFVLLIRHLEARGFDVELPRWLFGVARNVARNRRKRRGVWSRVATALRERTSRSLEPAPEIRLTLRAALAALSDKEREALVLREEMTAKEAAEILGISESAVYERCRAARARLARTFPDLVLSTDEDKP